MSGPNSDRKNTNAMLQEILLQRMPEPGDYPTSVTVVENKEYRYGAGSCLLAGVDMPTMRYLPHASPEKPYKEVTSMSPTKYHKHLRLYEAQRLMLENHAGAINAGYAVGYESQTQFTRECKRLFGAPPLQNVTRLR